MAELRKFPGDGRLWLGNELCAFIHIKHTLLMLDSVSLLRLGHYLAQVARILPPCRSTRSLPGIAYRCGVIICIGGMPMDGFKELSLKIDDGRKPMDFPLGRLAEYLTDFATLIGQKEFVHLAQVRDGSTMPCVLINEELEAQAIERIRQAKGQVGPPEANRAYKNIDNRLAEDNGVGAVLNERLDNLIEFPGKNREKFEVIGPFKEPAFIDGEIERVGGKDDSVPIWIKRSDGQTFHCETTKGIAKELAQHMYEPMRVMGLATRLRDEQGLWQLKKFVITGIEELSKDSLLEVVARLRSIEGDWENGPDVYADVQRIRHGEET